ncbi:MAG TPA: hypothetical protein VNN72_01320 [Polyangiaceae bacterium]|jgi:hypothetical protein|nr:hypothetical protein [Polyangiaceae bacterium]
MQRTASLLLPTLVAALFLTGCPEKKVEKEEPAAPTAVDKAAEKPAADEKAAAEEDHGGEDPEAQAEDPKADHKAAPKKKKAADEKDQGGW